jgi:cytochrome P450
LCVASSKLRLVASDLVYTNQRFQRETLRLTKALSRTIRVAEEDDILPLSSPIRTVGGTTISCVPIKKGERVQLGIPTFNVSTEIYGDDAEEFKPERWSDDGLASKSPLYRSFASWAPQLSFLGGPRCANCYHDVTLCLANFTLCKGAVRVFVLQFSN